MSVVWIVLGLLLLVVGGEFLVRSSVALSFKLNISKMVIGMTVVSFATSAPELLVSLESALEGSPDLAITNVVGSNIANIGLVLGITALVGAISVDKLFYKLNWPAMMLFSLALFYFLKNDNELTSTEGGFLFIALIVFLIILIRNAKEDKVSEDVDDALSSVSYFKIFIWLLIGGISLKYGADFLVDGAVNLATSIGVSEATIGLTIVAFGTSVPELAASVISAAKQEKALSIGNLIGSNIFNIGSVLGLTAIVKSIPLSDPIILNSHIYWMLGFAAILIPMIMIPSKMEIGRKEGLVLVLAYGILIMQAFI